MLGADMFPEVVTAAEPAIANIGRAPISIAGRIAIAVARATIDILAPIAEELLTERLGIPLIFWGSELPETTQHTFEAITGTSAGFKDGYGKASAFLGRVAPEWNRAWLNKFVPSPRPNGVIADEYPYYTTFPGGPYFYQFHQVSVKLVSDYEQRGKNPNPPYARAQGPKLNTFYSIGTGADVVADDPIKMWFGVGVTQQKSFFIKRDGSRGEFPYP